MRRCQISSLQNQIHSQESDLQYQEEELSRAKADLGRLQQEETQLEQSLAAGKVQLETIIKSLKATQDEINQVGSRAAPGLQASPLPPEDAEMMTILSNSFINVQLYEHSVVSYDVVIIGIAYLKEVHAQRLYCR